MIEIRCLEATFSCKSHDLSDWYQSYISCKKAGKQKNKNRVMTSSPPRFSGNQLNVSETMPAWEAEASHADRV